MPNEETNQKDVFPPKYMKKLQSLAAEFVETIDGMDTEEIKKRILSSENNIYSIEKDKDNNPKILDMKRELKDMTAPYSEAKGLETAKIKFCLFTLSNRGIDM